MHTLHPVKIWFSLAYSYFIIKVYNIAHIETKTLNTLDVITSTQVDIHMTIQFQEFYTSKTFNLLATYNSALHNDYVILLTLQTFI